ncbi:helix-turn-helix transcriptional regulator [Candidatus Micrarchaeota archaeon]|nr:helix-turn-helix transcriptional regulator [Candidatus Micrarchaeota archaeon]
MGSNCGKCESAGQDGVGGLACPILENLEFLERKWTLRILREISAGETKFNKIKERVKGITASVLSARLQELEKAEIIKRIVSNTAPVAVEYAPTEKAGRIFACWFTNAT